MTEFVSDLDDETLYAAKGGGGTAPGLASQQNDGRAGKADDRPEEAPLQ
jgi:hypothetical protein